LQTEVAALKSENHFISSKLALVESNMIQMSIGIDNNRKAARILNEVPETIK
jgi:hypothetical protein